MGQMLLKTFDPGNRLVADELETRWNVALSRVQELEEKLQQVDASANTTPGIDKQVLLRLAQDMPQVWESWQDMGLKQRIARILIQEIVVDLDSQTNEIVMKIHWVGGWSAHRNSSRQAQDRRESLPNGQRGIGGYPSDGQPLPGRSDRVDAESAGTEDRRR
jgi:hypothetical protein